MNPTLDGDQPDLPRDRWAGPAVGGAPAVSGAEPDLADEDCGLYGPTSVTWRLHSDPLVDLATLRFLLLQALHPCTTAAADVHGRMPGDPWHRLARTAEYLALTTFGSRHEAMLAAARLRAVHARAVGTTPDGRPYAADDVDLQVWVHCCLVDSVLDVVPRGGLELTAAERDAYVAEQVLAATLVGLEPDAVPHDQAGLARGFRRLRPALRATASARELAAVVISHGAGPDDDEPWLEGPIRPVWASVAGLAFAALPGWARRLYALPDLPSAAGLEGPATAFALRSLRTALLGAGGAAFAPGSL